jgi:hypothetical protein
MKSTSVTTCALVGALCLSTTACKQILLDGQIESTRQASVAVDSLSDYEVANAIAFAGIGQFEGMHYLAPDNEDALFMLTKAWTGASIGFIEDLMEQAEDAEGIDGALYQYHNARAKAAYDRAIFYGIELLNKRNPGFEQARRNDDTMKAWLAGFVEPEVDTPYLFWTANAWMSKTNVAKEDPAVVADLFIGVAMMRRAVELDENYLFGTGHAALGSYHARSPMAELDDSKKQFDQAIKISAGKMLMIQVQYASKYLCLKGDRAGYEKTLNDVIAAPTPSPETRLTNTIAKRRAKRYLSPVRMKNCAF